MKKTFAKIVENLHTLVYSASYMESAKRNKTDFTRRRKMSFVQYILFILHKTCRSLQAGLNTFFLSMGEEPGNYSKQAFSKGRLRIKPEAIRTLFEFVVNEFYAEADFQTFEGYRVLAIDGTKLNLPNTTELADEFGVQKTPGAPQVQALASGLYDVLNKIMVDVRISPCSANERTHAEEMVKGLRENDLKQKNIVLLDRGYPSADMLHLLQNEGHAFVVRCNKEFVRGMELTSDDCEVEHRFAKKKKHPLKLRVVKIQIAENTEEILATNLFADEFSKDELAQIYAMRWGIETSYNIIKNKLCVEAFSGISKTVILQDFYATMFLWNLAEVMAFDMADEIVAAHSSDGNKYEYQLNLSMTISTLNERVIELVMCENKRKSKRILKQISKALHYSVVPIVPGRAFPRATKHRSYRFHNNAKRI